jgi:predicted Rossmann fold nucleotide-binding protein DprA/Smf involved in DNA uptake
MILAIVGTRRFSNPKGLDYARMIIAYEVSQFNCWDSFVTGDAPGIDALVKETCDAWDRECQVLAPRYKRWENDGFQARNIRIAEACDELLCIRDPESTTYGSGWTADYADTLGKPVTRVTIS